MSDGLFDDLEELPHEEIEDKVKQLERDLRSLDDEFNSLRQDRRSQVDIVKSLRGPSAELKRQIVRGVICYVNFMR